MLLFIAKVPFYIQLMCPGLLEKSASSHFEAFPGRSSYFSAPGPTNGSIFKASSQQMFLFLFLLVALILTSRAGPFHVVACR